jgi:quinol monooxygenase YgiN
VGEDLEIWVVAGVYQARSGREAELAAVLANYIVLTRGVAGCRNVDLVASAGTPGKYLVIEKWVDADAQRAHLDSPVMVDMATAATPMLAGPPDLDLYEAISAQDLE